MKKGTKLHSNFVPFFGYFDEMGPYEIEKRYNVVRF